MYLGVLGKTEGADPTADVFEQYDEYIESQVWREYLFHRLSWIKNKGKKLWFLKMELAYKDKGPVLWQPHREG
jgi:hypothetical protein